MSAPTVPSRSPSPEDPTLDSEKLLELPILPGALVSATQSIPLKYPIILSYLLLIVLSITYLSLSGYASFWRTSAYIGAIAGLNSVFFAFALACVCAKAIHPLARPHSAALGVRIWAMILAAAWAAAVIFISSYATARWKWASPGPPRPWVFAELGSAVATFLASMLVVLLQISQHNRYKNQGNGR